jgi:hypothetical protein
MFEALVRESVGAAKLGNVKQATEKTVVRVKSLVATYDNIYERNWQEK